MIEQLNETQFLPALPNLVSLLQDSVDDGASIGFLPPLETHEAEDYWQEVRRSIAHQSRILLVAYEEQSIAGAVQLAFVNKPNASHRAEVQKLLVHRSFRRRGLGRALMLAAETAARQADRHLLVLDTRVGDASESLYRSLGYAELGIIPRYARSASGSLDDCIFFYKELD